MFSTTCRTRTSQSTFRGYIGISDLEFVTNAYKLGKGDESILAMLLACVYLALLRRTPAVVARFVGTDHHKTNHHEISFRSRRWIASAQFNWEFSRDD